MKRFSIRGDRVSGYETVIDGVDVSDQITGTRLTLGDGAPPELIVSTNTARIDIEADATIVLEDPAAELKAIITFLNDVDATALEEAMAMGGLEDGMAQLALRTLRRWAAQSYGMPEALVESGG